MSSGASSLRAPAAPRSSPELRVMRRSRRLIDRGAPRKVAPLMILAAIVAAAIVFGVLLGQVVLGQSAFKASDLRRSLQAAQERHEDLLLATAKLENPERIERYARQALGMVDPARVEYVVADVPAPQGPRLASSPAAPRSSSARGLTAAARAEASVP